MEGVLQNLPPGGHAAVLRLRSLGDCVLTTPALEILKRARPDLRLAVMVEDRFRAIFEGNPDIDDLLPARLGALRGFRPDLCLNLHGGARSAWLTAASGARWRAGFGHFRHSCVYNVRIPRAQQILGEERKVHTAEHLASAIFYLGAERVDIPRARLYADNGGAEPLVCPGTPGPAVRARDQIPASLNWPAGGPASRPGDLPHYAVIHPVAAAPEKTWPADRFVAVAEHLRQIGTEPVFIGAASDDLSPFRAFLTICGDPLAEIKSLLSGASLFIGNDSGPAHMAAASGLPVVVLFGASDPVIWGPWRTASETITSPGGISQITTARVIEALARLRVHA